MPNFPNEMGGVKAKDFFRWGVLRDSPSETERQRATDRDKKYSFRKYLCVKTLKLIVKIKISRKPKANA